MAFAATVAAVAVIVVVICGGGSGGGGCNFDKQTALKQVKWLREAQKPLAVLPLLKSKFQGTGCNTVVAVAVAIAIAVVTVIIFSQSLSLIIILELKLNLSACACLAPEPKQRGWHSTEIPCKCTLTLLQSVASLAMNVAEHRPAEHCPQLISDLCRIFWVRHRFCIHSVDNTARPQKGACIVLAWNATHSHRDRHSLA